MLASTLSLRAVGPATVLSHKCDMLSLLKDDHIVRNNRFPVHCRHLRRGDRFHREKNVRAACLQSETAPEKLLNRYEKRFEKREKRSEKQSETRPKNVYLLSGRLKIFHRHFSTNFKSFSPPKICTIFFFQREALQG